MKLPTLVLAWSEYRFWQFGDLYCVAKGTDVAPSVMMFCYHSLDYLFDVKGVPSEVRP